MTDTPANTFDADTSASTPAAEKAQATASTAAEEGKHVAGVAQGEAAKVATEAKEQVKSVAGEARTQVAEQVTDQTKQQRDRLVSTLGSLGDDLDQMAERSDGGLAADATREVAAHAKSLTSYLDGREPAEMLEDVRDFARRRPGLFLAGALLAGVVAGRLARGVKDADSKTSGEAQPSSPPPTFGAPPASPPSPMSSPSTRPVYDQEPTQAFNPLEAPVPPTSPPPVTPPVTPPSYPSGQPPYSGGPRPDGLS